MMGRSESATGHAPTQLGRYRIVGRIGAGPTAVVYKAWDDDLLREVAIKVPHAGALSGPGVDDNLAHARQITDLDPSQTVQPFDSGRADDGSQYFVFKYLSGGNLADRCRRTPLGPRAAVELAIDIAEILHQAHKAGFEHGNLKPSNILFDEQRRPCLGDFGLPPTQVGTHEADAPDAVYQSPEQLCGEQHRIDARTDVYSLAAVLYELLAGQCPWADCHRAEFADRILTDEWPPLTDFSPGLPPELAHVVHKALSPRVADRYTTIVDFAGELKLCLPRLAADPEQASPALALSRFVQGRQSRSARASAACRPQRRPAMMR